MSENPDSIDVDIKGCASCGRNHDKLIAIEREKFRNLSGEDFPEGAYITRCPETRVLVGIVLGGTTTVGDD